MDVLGLFMRVQQTNNKYSCKVPPGKINRRHIFRCFWWYLFIFAALRHQFTEKYARTRQNLAPDLDRSSLFLFPQMAGLKSGGGATGRIGVGCFSVALGCGAGISRGTSLAGVVFAFGWLADWFDLPLLGAVFAGATNTPLACIFMGIELFGVESGVFIALAVVMAYLFSGHTGIYDSQVIGSPKHLLLGRERGRALHDL